jgi:copper chaperone CopZ
MERVTFSVPTLYADHHVLNVRKTLFALAGVQDVIASAMYRDVTVDFDPAKTTADAIRQTVEAAGYPIGVEPEMSAMIESKHDGSPWYTIQRRSVTTVMLDREMSGDFRKY